MTDHSADHTSDVWEPKLDRMMERDMDEAASFVGRTMDSGEESYARKTMGFHFHCRQQKFDDGRDYYVWRADGRIAGLVGLHHYIWGPRENVWLGWFAVDSKYRRRGVGRRLLSEICKVAGEKGYLKLYVETYSSEVFADARAFYEALGFVETGRIAGYMPDGADMVVYSINIKNSQL